MPTESEFKWRAAGAEDFERMLSAVRARFAGEISGPREWDIKDAYLDAPDGTLSARKIALRLRCGNGAYEATLKSKTQMVDGKAVRREETLPLPHAGNEAAALAALRATGSWEGVSLADVRVAFYIINRRLAYRLVCAETEYELALDDVCICAGSRTLAMKEIELELKRGTDKEFSAFAAALGESSGLRAPEKSKVETAADLLKGEEQ